MPLGTAILIGVNVTVPIATFCEGGTPSNMSRLACAIAARSDRWPPKSQTSAGATSFK
jgi:hypothetical protein